MTYKNWRVKRNSRAENLNFLDLTGNVRLVLARPGLYVETQGAQQDPSPKRQPGRSHVVSPATLAQVRSAVTAKQVTDRYLWGLARHYRGLLVTFDRGLAAAGGDDVRLLIPQS